MTSPASGSAAETAKAHLDALNTILLVPLPVLIVIAGAIASHAPSAKIGDIDVELNIANLAALAVTGFAFLTAARHAAVINRCLRDPSEGLVVRRVVEAHVGALNPFFHLQRDSGLDWVERRMSDVLHAVPKLSVGLLFGFVWMFHPRAPNAAITATGDFLSGAIVATILFVVAMLSAPAMIATALAATKRWGAIAILFAGVALGGWVGSRAALDLDNGARVSASVVKASPAK